MTVKESVQGGVHVLSDNATTLKIFTFLSFDIESLQMMVITLWSLKLYFVGV